MSFQFGFNFACFIHIYFFIQVKRKLKNSNRYRQKETTIEVAQIDFLKQKLQKKIPLKCINLLQKVPYTKKQPCIVERTTEKREKFVFTNNR